MHRHLAVFGLITIAALSAGTAFAQERAGTPGSPAVATANSGDKKAEPMVCRRLTVVGSRMPKRVCATKVEWAEQTKRNAQELLDGQQQSDQRSFRIPGSGGQ